LSPCERINESPGGGCGLGTAHYRAAIIGLGQIGNQFDDDPKRTAVWTHAGAYASLPEIALIAGADPDEGRLGRFLERRGVAAGYRDYRDMLRGETIDLLSVCSPTALHHEMVLAGVQAGVRAIFCEKPLAATVAQAADMVRACDDAGVLLAVNHTRRWEDIYRRARRLLEQGAIGRLESLVGCYPGKVFTMGTHLFDLMRYFAGDAAWACGQAVGHGDEANLSGHLGFRSGAQGSVVCGWERANHIFEVDLLGSRGRLRLSGDGAMMELFRFEDSPRYSGYRELAEAREGASGSDGPVHEENRLIAAVRDLARCLTDGGTPACGGADGAAAVEIAEALCESAARGGARIELGGSKRWRR
jgi:predicted dehydrogenase